MNMPGHNRKRYFLVQSIFVMRKTASRENARDPIALPAPTTRIRRQFRPLLKDVDEVAGEPVQ